MFCLAEAKEEPRSIHDLFFVVGPNQIPVAYCNKELGQVARLQVATYFKRQQCNLVVPGCEICLQLAIDKAMDMAAEMLATGKLQVLYGAVPWKALPAW